MEATIRTKVTIILAFVLLSLLFRFYPSIDLWITGVFWKQDTGFYLGDWLPFTVLYWVFAKLSGPLALGLLFYWLSALFLAKPLGWTAGHVLKRYQQQALFLLLVLVIGTLLIEVVLKLGWGRARPRDVVEFGGLLRFTPAWVFSDQCQANCSFMSGHASFGYYFMVLAWLKRRWLWLAPGVVLGVLLGLTRIAQGGHFASDVMLPFFVVIGLSYVLGKRVLRSPSTTDTVDDPA